LSRPSNRRYVLLTSSEIERLKAAYGSDFYLALMKARADLQAAMHDLNIVMREAYDLIEEGDVS